MNFACRFSVLQRWRDRISIDLSDPDACWIWGGKINNWGYGAVKVEGKDRPAHRVFYEIFHGDLPASDRVATAERIEVDHTCRVRACVNPSHLQLVTHSENSALAHLRKTHCPKGHAFSDENTQVNRDGARVCRTCNRNRMRVLRASKKLAA